MFRIIPSKIIEFREYFENDKKILEKISYNNSEYFFDTLIEDLDTLVKNIKKLNTIKMAGYELVDQFHYGKNWFSQFLIKDQKKEIVDYIEQEYFEKIIQGEIYFAEKEYCLGTSFTETAKSSKILFSMKTDKQFEEKNVMLLKGPFLIKDEDANIIKKINVIKD
jgi:hypothetical protein